MDSERLWKTASMTDMNGGNNVSILDLTAVALGKKIKDGEITAVEATKAALAADQDSGAGFKLLCDRG